MKYQDFLLPVEAESIGAWAVYPYDEVVYSNLAFRTRFDDDVWLCKKAGDKMLVPRGLAPSAAKDTRTTRHEMVRRDAIGVIAGFPPFL